MKRKDNSKKIVASVLLLLVMICAAVYGVALYHGNDGKGEGISNGNQSCFDRRG